MKSKNIISEMTDQELLKKLKDDKMSFNKLKLYHKASSLDSPIEIRYKRREIARLLTEINKRNIS
ncbi:MAG: 50S ribosomal protein L29 [Flavobacteriales bacterium]|jgi:large subunit ribosomal protein L29|nr:50S ribosomal protein L29 [Flavobacteriales bacterium]|tara:strand:- start:9789 stop:9983 length:195 start_codon:yes stop_codon:yes gene_type:complete